VVDEALDAEVGVLVERQEGDATEHVQQVAGGRPHSLQVLRRNHKISLINI